MPRKMRSFDWGLLDKENITDALARTPSVQNGATVNADLVSRGRLFVALLAALLALGLAGQLFAPARADAAGQPADLRVGHTMKTITVNGRSVDVHLWYPADPQGLSAWPKTVYRSALWGRCSSTFIPPAGEACPALPLSPLGWTPLSWTVDAEVAREGAPIDPYGPAFPVIVFSHGSNNDPIDYAYTLEELAGAGFVVAAPYHVYNTQDDARIDYINGLPKITLFSCNDLLASPSPCSRASVPNNMRDRVDDIRRVLKELPGWFGDRVDMTRVGVMGHSRGTVTALTAVGGSVGWGIDPVCRVLAADGSCSEPAVKAVMGLAIGAANITNMVNLANVKVPTVLVAGGRDQNPGQAVSENAFAAISSLDKLFVGIPNAVHRSFDSTYCAELQSAAAAYVTSNPKAILDLHTVQLIAASYPGYLSGKAVQYCAPQYFTSPVQQVVALIPNSEYSCDPLPGAPPCYLIAPTYVPPNVPPNTVPTCPTNTLLTNDIPCTGLDTEEVKQGIVKIAVAFFDSALKRTGNRGIDFTRYLAPKWLMEHVPMVGSAEAYAGPDSICPPGQGVICAK
jgi:predicted dienelactone hydrolase